MPNLLAMSFEGALAPSFDLRCLQPGRPLPDGWGLGYYPGGEPSATVLKEPAPAEGSIRGELVKVWDHLASSLVVLHVRTATWGQISDANTQPFSRSWGGRDWLFCHSGSLKERLVVQSRFEPVGSTDSELVFCDLLGRMAESKARSIADLDLARFREDLASLNQHGCLNIVLADGRDLVVYADAFGEGGLHVAELLPPYGAFSFGDEGLSVDLTKRGVMSRKGVIVSSEPLTRSDGVAFDWKRIPAGNLLCVRQGAITATIAPTEGVRLSVSSRVSRPVPIAPKRAEPKTFEVRHRTTYRYAQPVERSTHLLRLSPVHDRLQTVRTHTLKLMLDGKDTPAKQADFDDVFGNRVRRVAFETPFRELVVEATSTIDEHDVDPLSFRPVHARSTIPLVWMPWQREVLAPFLLPAELPETQLAELVDYGMSFVERNDYDLLDTLLDINRSIFKEYKYVQGVTTLATSAFDVYANRRGVCQDFTNLFICLARLLGVPARYACGYIYTGPKGENRAQSEASHAWSQVYLPEVGWKGFDPTNGILTQTDHVRVAVGRNYRDATPTSGTIYAGGGAETLEVDVRVELAK